MKKRNLIRIICLVLCAVLMCSVFASCSPKKGKRLMSMGKHEISVNMFELFMSRHKAYLAYAGSNVTSDAFWNTIADMETQSTYDDYFTEKIYEQCKRYLAIMYLFEQEGLKLSQETLDKIDKKLDEYVQSHGDGSKNSFNSLLADYGVNYNILRDVYILEAKENALLKHYYGTDASQISTEAKNQFLRDNYYCFKQCFLPYYYNVYETDANGDVIYYDQLSNEYLYDKENGQRKTDDNGDYIKDKFGNEIYYNEDGSIAYDSENGKHIEIDKDGDDKCDIAFYSEEEQKDTLKQAEELTRQAQEMKISISLFGAMIDEYSAAADKYEYAMFSSSPSTNYEADMLNGLKKADEGEVFMVESEYGCHIIMKCEPEENAFSKSEHAQVFAEFTDYLMDKLLEDRCKVHYDKVKIDDKNKKLVPSFKEVNTNYYY